MMMTFESISILIAFFALLVSSIAVFFNAIQTRKAVEAIKLQQQLSASAYVVDDLIRRFYALLKEGELHEKIIEPDWADNYWGLLAIEFYFFHNGVLPTFIFTLWMTDLANLYAGESGKEIRKSHVAFLEKNSPEYSKMIHFYEGIFQIAEQECSSNSERNRKIIEFISLWISKNKEFIRF